MDELEENLSSTKRTTPQFQELVYTPLTDYETTLESILCQVITYGIKSPKEENLLICSNSYHTDDEGIDELKFH